jgi:hypothetical protein
MKAYKVYRWINPRIEEVEIDRMSEKTVVVKGTSRKRDRKSIYYTDNYEDAKYHLAHGADHRPSHYIKVYKVLKDGKPRMEEHFAQSIGKSKVRFNGLYRDRVAKTCYYTDDIHDAKRHLAEALLRTAEFAQRLANEYHEQFSKLMDKREDLLKELEDAGQDKYYEFDLRK